MSEAAARLLDALAARGLSLGVAESLTGGRVAAVLTDVPGASRVLRGGVVSYATEVKVDVLGVGADVVADDGVVSARCAAQMAEGARRVLGADIALSTTGVAGPDQQEGKAVGTVFVGLATAEGTTTRELALAGDRDLIRTATVAAALALAWEVCGGGAANR